MKTYTDLQIIMDENEDLFNGLVESGEYKFRNWLVDNMRIYQYFVNFSISLKIAQKREYYSARTIWERIRWQTHVVEKARGGAVLKVNNNYAPFMARLVMRAEPELEGMFQKRGKQCLNSMNVGSL